MLTPASNQKQTKVSKLVGFRLADIINIVLYDIINVVGDPL
jgi:hypothetical protein